MRYVIDPGQVRCGWSRTSCAGDLRITSPPKLLYAVRSICRTPNLFWRVQRCRTAIDTQCRLSDERCPHALIHCMLLTGPEAQQLAIYIGWLMYATRGGVIAGTLFVVPTSS